MTLDDVTLAIFGAFGAGSGRGGAHMGKSRLTRNATVEPTESVGSSSSSLKRFLALEVRVFEHESRLIDLRLLFDSAQLVSTTF